MIHLQHPSSKGRANSKLRCLQVSRKIDKIKILALICFNSPWLVNGCTFFFPFLHGMHGRSGKSFRFYGMLRTFHCTERHAHLQSNCVH